MSDLPYCRLPWHSLYFEADGKIGNCCIAREYIGNVSNSSQVLTSDKNIEIKQAMLEHRSHPSCEACFVDRNDPLARHANRWFEEWNYPKKTYDIDTEDELLYLDVRWKNTCTLKCVYCTPTFSSSWAKELGVSIPDNKENFLQVKNNLANHLPNLKKIYLAGGEPLLIRDNEWLLKELYKVNPDCQILVNSNIQNLDTQVYKLLTKFNNVTWMISGENIGEKYEYIRHGSTWKVFEENLRTIGNQWDSNDITFNIVYHILNLTDITEILEYLYHNGFQDAYYNIEFAYGKLNPLQLSTELRSKDLHRVEEFLEQYPVFEDRLRTPLDRLKSNETIDFTGWHDHLDDIDSRFGTNWRTLWPEFNNFIIDT